MPDGPFQKLTLDLRIAADSLAAKPITIRSTGRELARSTAFSSGSQADDLPGVHRRGSGGPEASGAKSTRAVFQPAARGVPTPNHVEPVERVHIGIQGTRSHPAIPGNGEIGELSLKPSAQRDRESSTYASGDLGEWVQPYLSATWLDGVPVPGENRRQTVTRPYRIALAPPNAISAGLRAMRWRVFDSNGNLYGTTQKGGATTWKEWPGEAANLGRASIQNMKQDWFDPATIISSR